jgi:hypothetical protein
MAAVELLAQFGSASRVVRPIGARRAVVVHKGIAAGGAAGGPGDGPRRGTRRACRRPGVQESLLAQLGALYNAAALAELSPPAPWARPAGVPSGRGARALPGEGTRAGLGCMRSPAPATDRPVSPIASVGGGLISPTKHREKESWSSWSS